MRFQKPLVLGLVVSLSTVTGCAAGRRTDKPKELNGVQRGASDIARPQHPPVERTDEFHFDHPRVDDFVARYETNLREFFAGALSRGARYMPRMMSILRKEGVPTELAYLPLIESGYRTQAVSRAGAAGPWQFIPGTGRRYGLRIDRYVDERRDPVKATQAAARYLHDLHDMFGDWHLSLAAYNTGEGKISRILNSGVADDFWQMSDEGYLYRETENYVPGFLAAVQIARNPEAHGFEPPEDTEPLRYDVVSVSRSLPLSGVAELVGTSVEQIKDLNPALHHGVTPPGGYNVRIPKGTRDRFDDGIESYERQLAAVERERAERARREAQLRAQRAEEARRAKARRGKAGVMTARGNRRGTGVALAPAPRTRDKAGRSAATPKTTAAAASAARGNSSIAAANTKAATKMAAAKPATRGSVRPPATTKANAARSPQTASAGKAPARRGAALVTASRGAAAKRAKN